MRLFKKEVIKGIHDGVWGHLVGEHNVNVDTISKELKCVEQEGVLDGRIPVTFLRVFKPAEAEKREIVITGWETFDQHPELIIFEGYLTKLNRAHLERKRI